jgi:uncharacterized protein (TIGR02246 family)
MLLTARTPEDVHHCFEQALAANDIEALVAIYEPGAVMVPEAGEVVEGIDAIRVHLEEMMAIKPRLHSETTVTVRSGNVAMLRARWTMSIPSPDGDAELSGESTEVVRLQADGTWKCIIDNPYST